MLTNWCNYKCPFCFGIDGMHPKRPARAMDDDTFLGILAWLKRTEYKAPIHLMGGEPTLHPKFEWIVDTLLERDLPITVFSNLATEKAPVYTEKLSLLPINWVVNVNPPYKWEGRQRDRIEASLANLGTRASITFNIMPDEADNDWAIDLIRRFNLNKHIKVGFILPTYTHSNVSLREDEYAVVAERTVRLARRAAQEGIDLAYECGVPTCAFTDAQLGELWRLGNRVMSGCYSRLDIQPTGEVFYCLPLYTLAAKHYSEFPTYDAAKAWFEKIYAPYRRIGRRLECATCNLMCPDACNGACLAANLNGIKNLKIDTSL